MEEFLSHWYRSAYTTAGLFWMAFWAFGLGYLISSMIQVFVTKERMKQSMGEKGPKSVGLATFFGFISSSCSFAALATTRSLFTKGAGLVPSLAFLLASTNLVIELGIVIAIFLSWQFVVAEYLGGLLLILCMWLLVKWTLPKGLEKEARENAREEADDDTEDPEDWKKLITSMEGWRRVAHKYFMEWKMVWKDVTVGFTVAGAIAAFVPRSFFETLFVGSGSESPAFWEVLVQTLVGPVAAFFTFIGSMGNIPLAAVLFSNGVTFAGIVAFIFSDLVVFPVLRVQTKYYGWKMAVYILLVFLASLVGSALLLHYGFDLLGMLPSAESAKSVSDREFFKIDYTFFLNIGFAVMSVFLTGWHLKDFSSDGSEESPLGEKILFWLALFAFAWIIGGFVFGTA